MWKFAIRVLGSVIMATTLTAGPLVAVEKRPITVRDCVQTRRIIEGEVRVSSDGAFVAYVVKSPLVDTDRNNFRLYVRDLSQIERPDNGKILLEADRISGIRWLNGHRIVVRTEIKSETESKVQIAMLNVSTGEQEALNLPNGLADFTISADGNTIVYSTMAKPDDNLTANEEARQKEQALHGYVILPGHGSGVPTAHVAGNYEVFIAKRTNEGKFDAGRRLYFVGPEDLPRRSILKSATQFDLSPDGRHLLFVLQEDEVPAGWSDYPLIRWFRSMGPGASYVLGLYDIQTEQLRMAFDFPGEETSTKWADDSAAYAVVAPSPLGSPEGKKEAADGLLSGNLYWHTIRFSHVFVVDLLSGRTTRVLSRDSGEPGNPAYEHETPLHWQHADGEMLVRADEHTMVRMKLEGGIWKEKERRQQEDHDRFGSSFSSDGRRLVGIFQSPMIPPNLYITDLTSNQTRVLTDLNSEYGIIQLGQIEGIEWKNKYGSTTTGFLLKPVGYERGKRYPLVIMAVNPVHEFVSDLGYTTAYAPQSLANAGFLVLFAKYSGGEKAPTSAYPGKLATEYDWVSMVEGAIDLLVERGEADRNNVGLVGFSRTSWLTDFMITHSKFRFRAVSSADSSIFEYNSYFADNIGADFSVAEQQMGGPPLGESLKNWLNYSPPFKAQNVQEPVLKEFTPPMDFFEFFISLARQGKPVDLFYYPKGAHPLDTPFERVASLQRNVDWFRFWMQDYEGKAPDYDPEQYIRWRKLREQQEWNDRERARGKDPSAEFLRQTSPGAVVEEGERAPAAKEFMN